MEKIIHVKSGEVAATHRNRHGGYEFYKRDLNPGALHCNISQYEIPPGKSMCPYHYHINIEENFYIISGRGLLRTPDGERTVEAGDCIYFPAGPAGAHKLTNISEDEPLVYLDFDTKEKVNVCFYPDSNKMGVYSQGVRQIHRIGEKVDYYDGEN